ncbi:hypothetical protein Asp14428_47590 [Actinoplanes sp. NBRC 14428]|nr:hypothetical protein Asp14428_47590 [Actinoplanes sp. NBRC 14428]
MDVPEDLATTFVARPAEPGAPPAAASAPQQREAYAQLRRQDRLDALAQKVDSARRRARHARRSLRVAKFLKLDPALAQFFEADVIEASLAVGRAETELTDLRHTPVDTTLVTRAPHDWHRAYRDEAPPADPQPMLTPTGQLPTINPRASRDPAAATDTLGSSSAPSPNPPAPAAEPTAAAWEPTAPASQPTSPGAEPTAPGAEPSALAPEPTASAAEPPAFAAEPTGDPTVDAAPAARDRVRRDDHTDYLIHLADTHRAKIHHLADAAERHHPTDEFQADARLTQQDLQNLANRIDSVRAGAPAPTHLTPPAWARLNDDLDLRATAGVETGNESALTGSDDPPPIDRSRPYGKRGGLRPPLAVHQLDLERAMPRRSDGRVQRLADPREGGWFARANDGGPAADPTRGINCVDAVLSLFETYVHGRPRVAAPRTFDAYAQGEPTRPLGAEESGLARIEETTGGEFQGLCPYVGALPPEQAKAAVDQAMTNLHNHLYNAGPGAFAFIVTDSEQGTAHAWTAVNQNGTILFLDPQTARISETTPLYAHRGTTAPDNVVSMDALVVDSLGNPAPLPYHEAGLWSRKIPEPTGATLEHDQGEHDHQQHHADSPTEEQLTALTTSVTEAQSVADAALPRIRDLAAAIGGEVVDEENRVRPAASLISAFTATASSVDEFLEATTDRVRFSVVLPESDYAFRLVQALAHLEASGCQALEIASYWNNGRGHRNGLDVTVRTPAGFRMELQFPTELSRTVDSHTRELQELPNPTPIERVEAFLATLTINKLHAMPAHQPEGIPTLEGIIPVDTSLARWTTTPTGAAAWTAYREALAADDMTLNEALAHWALQPEDVPGIENLNPTTEPAPARSPSFLEPDTAALTIRPRTNNESPRDASSENESSPANPLAPQRSRAKCSANPRHAPTRDRNSIRKQRSDACSPLSPPATVRCSSPPWPRRRRRLLEFPPVFTEP